MCVGHSLFGVNLGGHFGLFVGLLLAKLLLKSQLNRFFLGFLPLELGFHLLSLFFLLTAKALLFVLELALLSFDLYKLALLLFDLGSLTNEFICVDLSGLFLLFLFFLLQLACVWILTQHCIELNGRVLLRLCSGLLLLRGEGRFGLLLLLLLD